MNDFFPECDSNSLFVFYPKYGFYAVFTPVGLTLIDRDSKAYDFCECLHNFYESNEIYDFAGFKCLRIPTSVEIIELIQEFVRIENKLRRQIELSQIEEEL